MIKPNYTMHNVALFVAMFALGFMFMAWAKERSRVCISTRIIVPSSYCYTWSDGYRQCKRPKEIDV